MYRLLVPLVLLVAPAAIAQTDADRRDVRQVVLDYVDALYQERPDLIARSVSTDLVKLGYYRPGGDPAQGYRAAPMTYAQLEALATTWNRDQHRVDPDSALRRVTVFEVLDQTATAKLEADWGVDYMHLQREQGRWQIVHVLWQEAPAARSSALDGTPADLPHVPLADVETENGSVTDRASGEPVTGLIVDDHPDGSPRARYAVVGGLAEGVWAEWYASGSPRYVGDWVAGKGHGTWTYFHETGAIREQSEVADDAWHGRSRGWHANGERAFSGMNRWSERDGVWRFWNEDGTLDRVETYQDGRLLP